MVLTCIFHESSFHEICTSLSRSRKRIGMRGRFSPDACPEGFRGKHRGGVNPEKPQLPKRFRPLGEYFIRRGG